MSSGVTSRSWLSTRAARSSSDLNTTTLPVFFIRCGLAAERLRIAPSGARLPYRPAIIVGEALSHRSACYCLCIQTQPALEFVEHDGQAAGAVKIFHVA